MEELGMTISGKGVDRLSLLITSEMRRANVTQEGDVTLILDERFYFRGMSSLLTVITLRLAGSSECHVKVITGGGGYGLFNLTMGTERDRNRDMLLLLEELCANHGWDMQIGKTVWDVPWEQPQDDVSSPSKCLGCGKTIPSGKAECTNCGWSYRNTPDTRKSQ